MQSWNQADGKEGTRRIFIGNTGKPGWDVGAFFLCQAAKLAVPGSSNVQVFAGCRRASCWRSQVGETGAENFGFWGEKPPRRVVLSIRSTWGHPCLADGPPVTSSEVFWGSLGFFWPVSLIAELLHGWHPCLGRGMLLVPCVRARGEQRSCLGTPKTHPSRLLIPDRPKGGSPSPVSGCWEKGKDVPRQ